MSTGIVTYNFGTITNCAADQLPRKLAALHAQWDALRAPDRHDTEACAVLARHATRRGHPLPVPVLRWPTKGADPFAPPTLEEVQ